LKGKDMVWVLGREWTICKINFQYNLKREEKRGEERILQKGEGRGGEGRKENYILFCEDQTIEEFNCQFAL
jgi:hypothetical protein